MRTVLLLSLYIYLLIEFRFSHERRNLPPVLLFLQVIEPHDISVALNTRKLWSMHLHVQAKLIQEIVRSFSGSSCQPIQHMLRRICVQLCDLASPTALLIMRTVLDLIVEDLQRYLCFLLQTCLKWTVKFTLVLCSRFSREKILSEILLIHYELSEFSVQCCILCPENA